MKKNIFKLDTLTCPSCVRKIEIALSKTTGVNEVEVMFNSSRAVVGYDEEVISKDAIVEVIQNLGFDVLKVL